MSEYDIGKGRKILGGVALVIVLGVCLLFVIEEFGGNGMRVSLESGIYDSGVSITVNHSGRCDIYYRIYGEEEREYTGPIVLEADSDGIFYDITFMAYYEDGTQLEEERVYYIIPMEERHVGTDYIVALWGDEDELFGDERGIFVRGNQFYEYMEENPDTDVINTVIPANYFSDSIVNTHCVILSASGELLIDQDCGLNIYGNVTRAKNQKSFRLTAGYDYDEDNNRFEYPFLTDLTDEGGGVVYRYKKISFHNSGNDNGYGFIRNQLCNELARQTGFPDVLVSQSATVYVNDRYMGTYWMENAYDKTYFKEKYGEYEGEMIVLEGSLSVVEDEDEEESGIKCAEEYNRFIDEIAQSDITDEAVWNEVKSTVDVENFLQYMAIEYYVNNTDWPGNNVKVYRYVSDDGEYYENSVFDGRYRYILYDLDYGMGLMFQGWFGRDAYSESLQSIIDGSDGELFAALMDREDCRQLFINDVMDLRNGCFSVGNVVETLNEMNDTRWDELVYMMEETDILKDSLWESDDNDTGHVENELTRIGDFADKRQYRVIDEMTDVFGLGPVTYFNLVSDEDAPIMINETLMYAYAEDIVYFTDIPIKISVSCESEAVVANGYYLNGIYVPGEEIVIVPGDYAQDGYITIEADIDRYECASLTVDAYRTRGSEDYVVLKNTGSSDILLNEYYLSDDEEDIYKYRLPAERLMPGETATFYGNSYDFEDVETTHRLSFSWSDDEPLILSNVTDGVLEESNTGTFGAALKESLRED